MGLKKVFESGAAVVAKRHLKFDDDAEDSFHTADEGNSTLDAVNVTKKQAVDSDSESDSESDAPEEEGLSSGKNVLEEKIRAQEEAKRAQEEEARERRRKNERIFKQQQLEKKKKLELEEAKQRSNVKSSNVSVRADNIEDPEELPQEFFDELETKEEDTEGNDKVKELSVKPKHINFSDRDLEAAREEEKAVREEIRKQKRRTLRDLRKTQVQKGPVTVNLLSSMKVSKSLAPKRETSILKSKDKWLKRRSLKRK